MKLIKRLWGGEVSLGCVFWLYGVLVGFLFNLLFAAILLFYASISASVPFLSAIVWILTIIYFIYLIFIYLVIWRTAGKYQGKKVWSILARICVVLGFLGLALNAVHIAQHGTMTVSVPEAKASSMQLAASDSSSSNSVLNETDELNKGLPKMVDEITRLDSITAEGHSLKYNYTLVTVKIDDIDVNKFNKSMRSSLLKKICGDADLKTVFKQGANSIIFSYRDIKGNGITDVVITAADCND
jgi:hypothetical protein